MILLASATPSYCRAAYSNGCISHAIKKGSTQAPKSEGHAIVRVRLDSQLGALGKDILTIFSGDASTRSSSKRQEYVGTESRCTPLGGYGVQVEAAQVLRSRHETGGPTGISSDVFPAEVEENVNDKLVKDTP